MSKYEGQPYIYLTPNGADMKCRAGVQVMDAGLENAILMSIMVGPKGSFPGDYLLGSSRHKAVRSKFSEVKVLPSPDTDEVTKIFLVFLPEAR